MKIYVFFRVFFLGTTIWVDFFFLVEIVDPIRPCSWGSVMNDDLWLIDSNWIEEFIVIKIKTTFSKLLIFLVVWLITFKILQN